MDEPGSAKLRAVIDARGLACPMPLVKLRQALMVVGSGERVCLLATDPAAPSDVLAFCEAGRHRLVDEEETGGLFTLVVEKGG
ncbi:MAG: sulfurtransferase TusA family protein [Pseudomonadota bacterium]